MRIQFINSLKPISSEGALKFLCFLASSPLDDLNQFLELTQERGVARVEAICINLSSLFLRICEQAVRHWVRQTLSSSHTTYDVGISFHEAWVVGEILDLHECDGD
jgi:hypothetical protein